MGILEEQRKKTEELERSLKKQESQKEHLGSVTGAKPAGRPPPRSSVSSNLFDSDDDDASMLAPKAKAPAATAKTPAKVVPRSRQRTTTICSATAMMTTTMGSSQFL